jgi:hypothetical protein
MKYLDYLAFFAAGFIVGAIVLAIDLAIKGMFTEHFFILPLN